MTKTSKFFRTKSNPFTIGWNRAIGFILSDTRNLDADFAEAAAKRCDDINAEDRAEAIRGFIAYCEHSKEV